MDKIRMIRIRERRLRKAGYAYQVKYGNKTVLIKSVARQQPSDISSTLWVEIYVSESQDDEASLKIK